ncbi:MAG: hydroxymethylglutaryl-CoA reductase, degradative [Chloroflexota bacterium]|nr:hydroxymethylglutaryl-CoA reductase, degradative [Chloroflexota bacterium]
MTRERRSTISGLYKKPLAERQAITRDWADLSAEDLQNLEEGGLALHEADLMIENVIGRYSLPFGVATNFLINDIDYLVPMVIEEPSVVAACSFAAKLFRAGGGFQASSDDSLMTGQIQLLDVKDRDRVVGAIEQHKAEIIDKANETAGSIKERGGGAVDLRTRIFKNTSIGEMIVVHLLYDARDAMGANAVNTALEHVSPFIEKISGARANLRILSNLSDHRRVWAEGSIPASAFGKEYASGEEVIDGILEAAVFAELDPYRAATHNKGIMNGIDALLIATGNDWRAVEAGAHAYAARAGRYSSLSRWWKDESGDLRGRIELPLAVGIVGGATRVHRLAQTALKILGLRSARQLAEVAAAVGLAQNLAAMRALATDGIQSGHMRMHARQLAIAAGAHVEDVLAIAQQMEAEGKIRLERARELVKQRKSRS